MKKRVLLFATFALGACAGRPPEQITANANALAVAKAQFALTPQLRMEIAQTTVGVIRRSAFLSQRTFSSPTISDVKTDAGYKDLFGGSLDSTPFYCVRFMSHEMFFEAPVIITIGVIDSGGGARTFRGLFAAGRHPVKCEHDANYVPFPELAAAYPASGK
ncbi:MAG: hypothetical protein JO107_14515 [Hyphomicrobiales bacterium]|nr:hypothetical protein [Hyphomicrobiales bacterium]MBV8664303.1 hypothetical protein [Hyphomicrobiales bacterium]